jgi:ABC-type sugar transport system ATPase subunit
MSEICLEGIGKRFAPGIDALRDVNLLVERGEWLVLVGPSGCGKTTLLRIIAGLDRPTSGTVRFAGKNVTDVPAWQRNVAFLFQRPALTAACTVKENLAWPFLLKRREPWGTLRRLLGRRSPTAEQEVAIRRVAELVGVAALLDRRVDQLSGGQQQRVALGRALVRQAGVCLLDEPLAQLDAPLRTQLRREMRLLSCQLPATMVYVTHDPAEALALGEKIAVLHEGRVQQVDRPHRIWERPANRVVAELFAQADGGINLIPGELLDVGGERFFSGPWEFAVGT